MLLNYFIRKNSVYDKIKCFFFWNFHRKPNLVTKYYLNYQSINNNMSLVWSKINVSNVFLTGRKLNVPRTFLAGGYYFTVLILLIKGIFFYKNNLKKSWFFGSETIISLFLSCRIFRHQSRKRQGKISKFLKLSGVFRNLSNIKDGAFLRK